MEAARRMFVKVALLGLPLATSEAQYVGFGANSQGAAGCTPFTIYHVTSLANSGAGTLRDAVAADCRQIVFDVGGTIQLTSTLNINRSFLTIDGSSAPPPGITIDAPGIRIAIEASASIGAAHDIIIHHLRVQGDGSEIESSDILELDGQSAAVYNVVLDHITAISSSDGNFDVWGEVRDVTIPNNLIRDSVQGHHFSNETQVRERVTIFQNVYARNNERQVRMRYNNRFIDIVNNVIYGWGWFAGGAAGLDLPSDPGYSPSINVENNVYHYVSSSPNGGPDDALLFDAGSFPGDIYFAGNIVPSGESDAVSTAPRTTIPAYAEVPKQAASALGSSVVPCAGTQPPTSAETQLLSTISVAIGGASGACVRPNAPQNLAAQ